MTTLTFHINAEMMAAAVLRGDLDDELEDARDLVAAAFHKRLQSLDPPNLSPGDRVRVRRSAPAIVAGLQGTVRTVGRSACVVELDHPQAGLQGREVTLFRFLVLAAGE